MITMIHFGQNVFLPDNDTVFMNPNSVEVGTEILRYYFFDDELELIAQFYGTVTYNASIYIIVNYTFQIEDSVSLNGLYQELSIDWNGLETSFTEDSIFQFTRDYTHDNDYFFDANVNLRYFNLDSLEVNTSYFFWVVIVFQNPIPTNINKPSFSENNEILIYPNPIVNNIKVKTRPDSKELIRIYDNFGHLLIETKKHTINFADYKSGFYFLNVNKKTYKIIKK